MTAYRVAFEKTVALGTRLDILFANIRTGFFYRDNDCVSRNIEKARAMIEEGGDWDRRNRLKVYEGAYLMTIRDFKGAADLFIATLSTFTSVEIMEYKEFVTYAVLSSVLALKRVDIKNKVTALTQETGELFFISEEKMEHEETETWLIVFFYLHP